MTSTRLARRLDRTIEILLLLLLAWLPFAFGGVLPLSHLAVVGVVAGCAFLVGVRALVAREPGFVWSWSFVPVFLFVLLVALQGMPIPIDTLESIAAPNAQRWRELAGADGLATISLYPHGTGTDLRLLLAGAVLFVVVLTVFRSNDSVRRLLTGIAIIGAVLAVQAALQTLSGSNKLLWTWDAPGGRATSGPFVHYGHFSQFVNLCLGAGFAVLFLRLSERGHKDRHDAEDLVRDLRSPDRRLDVFLLAFVVVGIVAVALSQSRNGVISLCVGGAVTASVMHGTRFLRGMGWPMGVLALLAFVTLVFVGFDPVYERMATLEDPVEAYEQRSAIARDAWAASQAFPLLGTGQGAFEYVFPVFDTSDRPGRAQHAENQWLELLVETGWVGALLGLSFLVLLLKGWVRRVRRRKDSGDAVLFGLGFGLIAVGFHALTDFGLRIPAVAALAVVCLALVVARGSSREMGGLKARVLGVLLGFGGAGLLLGFVPAIWSAHQADQAWREADRVEKGMAALTAGEQLHALDRQIGLLERAVALQPGNVDYPLRLANVIWQRAVQQEAEVEPLDEAAEARLREAAQRAYAILLRARTLAPTNGMVWSMLGQFGSQWLAVPGAAEWIHRGFAFDPENPDVCFVAGQQALGEGDAVRAAELFVRAIRMGASSSVVLEGIAVQLRRPEVAREVVRGDARMLVWLVGRFARMEASPELDELAKDMRAEARLLLEKRCSEPDPPAWMLSAMAQYSQQDGDPLAAVRYYRRYLTLVPDSDLRYSLAQAMHATGDVEGGKQELRRLLGLKPGHAGARRLLEQWAPPK